MSWGFKSLDTVTLPSVTAFAVLDPAHPGGIRPKELRDNHEAALELALPLRVPEPVRDYFDAVRMLWVFGWFYYPFYSFAILLSGLCAELALKERYRLEGLKLSRRDGSLAAMLEDAVARGWIVPEGFTAIRKGQEIQDFWGESEVEDHLSGPAPLSNIGQQSATMHSVMKRLLDNVRKIRNARAHPENLSLRLPGTSYAQLRFVADLIGQLFRPTV